MRQTILVSLFVILISDIMLGLGLALGPGLSLKNAFLYIIFIALVLEFSVGKRDLLRETWPLNGFWLLLILYATFTWLVVILLGVHRGYNPLLGFIALKGQLIDLYLFLVVYLFGPKDLLSANRLLRWLIIVLVIVNMITLVDVLNIPDLGIITDREDGRLAGPVNEVNQYGAVLIFMIPLTAGLAISSEGWRRHLLIAGTLVAFVLLGLTVSRGSYLGLIVGGLAALYLVRDHVQREAVIKGFVVISITVFVALAVSIYQNPEAFLEKFNFGGASLDSVSTGRILTWRQALTMMSYWPLSFVVGYGWSGYATLFLGYGDPHNSYLLYWFNLGIIGLGLYLLIVAWIVRFSLKCLLSVDENVKPIIIGFIIGFLSLHVAIFFVGLYLPWLFIWALAGATLRIMVEENRAGKSAAAQPNKDTGQP